MKQQVLAAALIAAAALATPGATEAQERRTDRPRTIEEILTGRRDRRTDRDVRRSRGSDSDRDSDSDRASDSDRDSDSDSDSDRKKTKRNRDRDERVLRGGTVRSDRGDIWSVLEEARRRRGGR